MMAVFDMTTNVPFSIVEQGDRINDRYFTIDTADLITVHEWINYNPYIVTYATYKDDVIGFFNILPITTECAALFDEQRIKEEDLTINHILPHASMEHAQYAYLAAVAVNDTDTYIHRQCAAALISNICDHLLNGYNKNKLKRIYANPTTFNGNHLVRKLGLKPVANYKTALKVNDIYAIDVTPETIDGMKYISQRYSRFVGSNPWSEDK